MSVLELSAAENNRIREIIQRKKAIALELQNEYISDDDIAYVLNSLDFLMSLGQRCWKRPDVEPIYPADTDEIALEFMMAVSDIGDAYVAAGHKDMLMAYAVGTAYLRAGLDEVADANGIDLLPSVPPETL